MGVIRGVIENTVPDGLSLDDKVCFLGMGFGTYDVPIDIVTLFLAGLSAKKYSLLLVDEFQRINGVPEAQVEYGLNLLRKSLNGLMSVYDFHPELILASDFMKSREYELVLKEIEERIQDKKLVEKLSLTVPERYRENADALVYAINEIACVEFLRRFEGIEVKIGPSKEKLYDEVMREIEMGVDFAYVIDAYALGTRILDPVVHYIPTHRGEGNGQRLFLDDTLQKAHSKLLMGPAQTSRYFLRVASLAGERLGKECLTSEEIELLSGIRLKKTAVRLLMENILRPYKEVVSDEY